MSEQVIGVIGGSGLYDFEGLEDVREERIETPFGEPSDLFVVGRFAEKTLIFLPRHGRGHRFTPSEVNYCANIYGFKKLGAQWLISISAVGSMREEIEPGHVVIADQFIDLTKRRRSTFFGDGVVGHVQFADPVCPVIADVLYQSAQAVGATAHEGGTYICIEGPQFSTRAESNLYRSWGVKVIGMTNMPEAKLAREAGLGYATVAMATDYDCWHNDHDDVSVDTVLETLKKNVSLAKAIIAEAARRLPVDSVSPFAEAGRQALFGDPAARDPKTRAMLEVLVGS